MALVAIPAGRLVFVAEWFSAYQEQPWSIFDIGDGGIDLWAAFGAATLMAVFRVHQRPLLFKPLSAGLIVAFGMWTAFQFLGFDTEKPPKDLPIVSLVDMEGRPEQLMAIPGKKPLVINVWATWCPPCRRELPTLARAQSLHWDVEFVFVDQGEPTEVVQKYLRAMPFKLLHVLIDEKNALGKAMNSSALPMTFIYDVNGKLAYRHQGVISEAVLAKHLEQCCQIRKKTSIDSK